MGPERASQPSARVETSGPRETEAHGAALAPTLALGSLVLVSGDLGTGKTTWVRGACRALGVSDLVRSPTFTIARRYSGSVAVAHLDLFRLDSLADEEPGLLDEYFDPAGVCFVEWPEHAGVDLALPVSAAVHISHRGGDRRLIVYGCPEAGWGHRTAGPEVPRR